jgi:transcriptional regulator of acetoin/glycerol metabolism
VRLPAEAEPDKPMIEAALQKARGVISQAAADLGLSRQALYRRMEKMGIES